MEGSPVPRGSSHPPDPVPTHLPLAPASKAPRSKACSPPGPSPQLEAGLPFPGSPLPGHRVFIPRPGSRERNKPRSEQRPGPISTTQLWLLKEQLVRKRRLSPTERHTPQLCLPSKNNAPGSTSQGIIYLGEKKKVLCTVLGRETMRMHPVQAGGRGLGHAGPPAPGLSQRVALGK